MAKLFDITGLALSGEWGIDDETGNGIPVLRTTNFTNDGIVNYNNVVTRIINKRNIDEKYLRKGDIIIEKSGGSDNQPVGRVIFFEGPEKTYLFNNFTGLLRVKDHTRWFPKYIFYALFANYRRGGTIQFENKTTGLHNLKTDDYVKRFAIVEKDIGTQRTICFQLDKVRQIISLRHSELSAFDNLIKARFVEMFVSKKYPVIELEKISLGKGEYGAQSASIEYDARRPRYVRITDINDDGTLNDDVVCSANISDDLQYKLEYGDFCFARMGATVGKTYSFKEGNQIFAGYLIRYKLNLDLIKPEYLYAYTTLDEYKAWVLLNQSGAAQPGINARKYGSLQIPLAPIKEQIAFVEFCKQIDKSKFVVQQALDKAKLLFDSLMQKYFGEMKE